MDKKPEFSFQQDLQLVESENMRGDPVRPKELCPKCGKGELDYNGLLELVCPSCGSRYGGGCGCT